MCACVCQHANIPRGQTDIFDQLTVQKLSMQILIFRNDFSK